MKSQTTRSLSLILFSALVFGGCAAGVEDEGDVTFRQADPGEIPDLAVHQGPNTDVPECLIWDITDGNVHDATVPGSPIIFSIVDGDTIMQGGEALCTREDNELSEVMLSGEGDVVLTLVGPLVFAGEVELPKNFAKRFNEDKKNTLKKLVKYYEGQFLYAYQAHQAFDDDPKEVDPIISATETLQHGGQMLRLSIAALLAGECGAPGFTP